MSTHTLSPVAPNRCNFAPSYLHSPTPGTGAPWAVSATSLVVITGWRTLLASRGQGPGLLSHTQQQTGQPSQETTVTPQMSTVPKLRIAEVPTWPGLTSPCVTADGPAEGGRPCQAPFYGEGTVHAPPCFLLGEAGQRAPPPGIWQMPQRSVMRKASGCPSFPTGSLVLPGPLPIAPPQIPPDCIYNDKGNIKIPN